MINNMVVQGKFQRFIHFNTSLDMAYTYFTDFTHVLPRLPEVERVLHYKDGRYRMYFTADDGRGHEMGIVFDIRHEAITNQQIKILPVPVSLQDLTGDRYSKNSAMFSGLFSGEVLFTPHPTHIQIDYSVDLIVEIEVPRFLNFIPKPMLQKLGDGLMQLKLHNIGAGFADNLENDFAEWHSQRLGELATLDNLSATN